MAGVGQLGRVLVLGLAVVIRHQLEKLLHVGVLHLADAHFQPGPKFLQCPQHRFEIRAALRTGVGDLGQFIFVHFAPVIAHYALRARDHAIALLPLIHHRHIPEPHIPGNRVALDVHHARELCAIHIGRRREQAHRFGRRSD